MFALGVLFFGNIIDNAGYIKKVVMAIHISLGFLWISTGIRVYYGAYNNCKELPIEKVGILEQLPASVIMLVNTI